MLAVVGKDYTLSSPMISGNNLCINICLCCKQGEVYRNTRSRQTPSYGVLTKHTAKEDLVTESHAVFSLKILAEQKYVDG